MTEGMRCMQKVLGSVPVDHLLMAPVQGEWRETTAWVLKKLLLAGTRQYWADGPGSGSLYGSFIYCFYLFSYLVYIVFIFKFYLKVVFKTSKKTSIMTKFYHDKVLQMLK